MGSWRSCEASLRWEDLLLTNTLHIAAIRIEAKPRKSMDQLSSPAPKVQYLWKSGMVKAAQFSYCAFDEGRGLHDVLIHDTENPLDGRMKARRCSTTPLRNLSPVLDEKLLQERAVATVLVLTVAAHREVGGV